jgi:hypothetical protein
VPSFKETLRNVKKPESHKKYPPLWKGPCVDGITYSLLSRFLVCRERFRISTIEGLGPEPRFSPQLEYGNMWHTCEEAKLNQVDWKKELLEYSKKLLRQYPAQSTDISHWYDMCRVQFEAYCRHWDHFHQTSGAGWVTVFSEQLFDTPYKIQQNYEWSIRLRGKIDGGLLIGNRLFVQENKTKSTIDRSNITSQLYYDMQTMMYLTMIAVELERRDCPWVKVLPKGVRVGGVIYNVVRRSSHKSPESMLKKIEEDIESNRASEWFDRWQVDIVPADIESFQRQTLRPVLNQLNEWYNVVSDCHEQGTDPFLHPSDLHYRYPNGIYNLLLSGGITDLDACLRTGSRVGLQRARTLFPELEAAHG